MKQPYKYFVHCNYYNFFCTGVSTNYTACDTDNSHFSFGVFSVEPEAFADAIEEMFQHSQDYEKRQDYKEITLQSARGSDTIRITLDGTNIGITRGNLKVLYYGSISTLSGLPKAIRKAVEQRDKRYQKELEQE